MVWKLKKKCKKIEKRVEELIDVETTNLWVSWRDGVIKACDELRGKNV